MLTFSMPITDFTIKVILKELVSSTTGSRKTAFHMRAPLIRGINQPSTSGADQADMPAVTAVTNTPATEMEARSASTITATPSPSTSAPVSTIRVPPKIRH